MKLFQKIVIFMLLGIGVYILIGIVRYFSIKNSISEINIKLRDNR